MQLLGLVYQSDVKSVQMRLWREMLRGSDAVGFHSNLLKISEKLWSVCSNLGPHLLISNDVPSTENGFLCVL